MASTPERSSHQGIPMILTGIVCAAVAAYAFRLMEVPTEVAGVLVSGVVALPPAIAARAAKRKRSERAELRALSRGHLSRPAPLVAGIVAAILLLSFNLFAFWTGLVLGLGPGLDPTLPMPSEDHLSAALGVAAFPLFFLTVFIVAHRACHYVSDHPYLWLLMATAIFGFVQIFIAAGSVSILEAFGAAVLFSPLTYGLVALGTFVGMRRHRQFVASTLLRKLPDTDLAAVTELIGEAVNDRIADPDSPPPAPAAQQG